MPGVVHQRPLTGVRKRLGEIGDRLEDLRAGEVLLLGDRDAECAERLGYRPRVTSGTTELADALVFLVADDKRRRQHLGADGRLRHVDLLADELLNLALGHQRAEHRQVLRPGGRVKWNRDASRYASGLSAFEQRVAQERRLPVRQDTERVVACLAHEMHEAGVLVLHQTHHEEKRKRGVRDTPIAFLPTLGGVLRELGHARPESGLLLRVLDEELQRKLGDRLSAQGRRRDKHARHRQLCGNMWLDVRREVLVAAAVDEHRARLARRVQCSDQL
mmetsp:Transcript_20216/g.49741  ORF Transcript_20216/g.49741 Transcript_20216/m.49741 type:complete len:275 (+) Transcript_20216:1091-1915(+)